MDETTRHPKTADLWIGLFVLGTIVLHLISTLAKPLGEVGPTRWGDWLDIPTPFLIIAAGAMALSKVKPSKRAWIVFVFGAVLYTEGHGIHLAANSIDYFAPGDTVHIWDETVGHHIWYGGMWVMVAVLFQAFAPLQRAWSPVAAGVAGLFGFNASLNANEGGTIALMIVASLAMVIAGWRYRRAMGLYFVIAGAVCLACIVGWGLYWGGFPQFSALGWI